MNRGFTERLLSALARGTRFTRRSMPRRRSGQTDVAFDLRRHADPRMAGHQPGRARECHQDHRRGAGRRPRVPYTVRRAQHHSTWARMEGLVSAHFCRRRRQGARIRRSGFVSIRSFYARVPRSMISSILRARWLAWAACSPNPSALVNDIAASYAVTSAPNDSPRLS